jgi:phosphoglycerol transferase MdoB-like AlkP superfamily enzyme
MSGMVLAAAGFALAALWIVSAYGLMTLQRWSPLMATVGFVLSIPVSAAHMWFERWPVSLAVHGGVIVVALAANWFLQWQSVQQLYQPQLAEAEAAA